MMNLDTIQSVLEKTSPYRELGRVEEVIGLVIESKGPKAKLGDLCYIHSDNNGQPPLPAEVVGLKGGNLLLMPFGELQSLSAGDWVVNTGKPFSVGVGPALLGRVLDGLGQPIDGKGPLFTETEMPALGEAPDPMSREVIKDQIIMGIRSIDGFMTMGKGQRMGVFAGSGVGKSTTMGMIARNTDADINVIALIGERGREVREFLEDALGEEGLKRSVVIVATSEQPALIKVKAGLVATTIAEYFRGQGKNVILMLDSVTRVAMALREVGLSVGEPPTSRGYTPSVFAFLPKLLERSGCDDKGSITGLYTVLVEGDDFNEPISDTVRGLLDGHIILSRDLAYQNHFPAVDVLGSISRLMVHVADDTHRQAAGTIRDLMAVYKKSEDIISIGAYVKGGNPKLDKAVELKDQIDAFLRQDVMENTRFEQTLARLNTLSQQAVGR